MEDPVSSPFTHPSISFSRRTGNAEIAVRGLCLIRFYPIHLPHGFLPAVFLSTN